MRTRLFLLISLLLGASSLFAQGWTPKTVENGDFYQEKVYYVNLSCPSQYVQVELAAFIDGECRALAEYPTEGLYVLRVAGDLTTEVGKDIVFKAFAQEGNNGRLIYVFKTKGKFTDENAEFNYPLTLDMFQGVTLPSEIVVNATLPTTYDLSQHFTYYYGTTGTSSNVELEPGQLSFSWSPASSTSIASINSSNVLTTTSTPGSTDMILTVTGTQYKDQWDNNHMQFYSQYPTTITVQAAATPVTSIQLNPTSITVSVDDNMYSSLTSMVQVTVLPDNATNKGYYWDYASEAEWIDQTSYTASKRGDYTIACRSLSNPSVYATLNVKVLGKVKFKVPDQITLGIRESTTVTFTDFEDPDNLFDPSKVTIDSQGIFGNYDGAMDFTLANNGKSFTLRGKYVGDWNFWVSYDGNQMETVSGYSFTDVHVEAILPLPATGWSWVSACYGVEDLDPSNVRIPIQENSSLAPFMSKVQELRTQTGLLYNDNGTLYGTITEMNPRDGMYKVRGNGTGANSINLGSRALFVATVAGYNFIQPIKKGYNWITYPYDVDLELSELAASLSADATVDDQIIGQQGFATFDGTNWVATNGFKFEAGKGYIYLSQKDTPYNIDFYFFGVPLCYQSNQNPVKELTFDDPWEMEEEGFVDNMPAILQIQDLPNADEYIIGAFVDGVCRGKATVGEDGRALLSVPGVGGEKVTFRLYNKESGEEVTLDQTLRHSSMAGRLSKPLQFAAPADVTGISVSTAKKAESQDIYSTSGLRLKKPVKGINITNGKKVIF